MSNNLRDKDFSNPNEYVEIMSDYYNGTLEYRIMEVTTTNKLIINNKINYNNIRNYINSVYWIIPMGQGSFKGDRYITSFI